MDEAPTAELTTGDLARETGNTVRAVRFYEEQGLLRPAAGGEGRHRRYTREELERLRLISDLREVGLSLCEIRAVLDLRSGCETAAEFALRFHTVLAAHLETTQRRIERLRAVSRELAEALAAIEERLSCEMTVRCPCAVAQALGAPRIVKVLAKDGLCDHEPKR
jgi:DNA-binding transcriptional MerR regulator